MPSSSHYKIAKHVNRKYFYGEVSLQIESITAMEHKIVEAYNGTGFVGQGYVETIPKEGYNDWKTGIKKGIEYALSQLVDTTKYRITITEAKGLSTDTSAVLLALVSSRAILNKLSHSESAIELQSIEHLVYDQSYTMVNSQINFKNLTIENE